MVMLLRKIIKRCICAGFFREQVHPSGVITLVGGLDQRISSAKHTDEDPDLKLVMAARNGDNEAFEAIVRKYQGKAFNIAFRMLSDREEARDLTQEVFIKIFRSLRSFRSESRFSHWFYAVLLNSCRSRLKHLKRRGFFSSQPLDNPGTAQSESPARQFKDKSPDASTVLEKKQIEEVVHEKIKLVQIEFRDVLILRDIQGFAYDEIASILGISIGTVKSRLHRGRTEMKNLLAEELEGLM